MSFFLSDSAIGISMWTILLSLLECTTVTLFFIGCVYYVRVAKKKGSRLSAALASVSTALAFIGGFPNALDKISRTLFSYDLWFNSTWMFFFVGISYISLFVSALCLNKKTKGTPLLSVVPAFHKPMKYVSMLFAAVGMTGFYITMFINARRVMGRYALLYLVTFLAPAFLVVFSAVGSFTTVWPNIIAQIVNSAGYAALIIANKKLLEKTA